MTPSDMALTDTGSSSLPTAPADPTPAHPASEHPASEHPASADPAKVGRYEIQGELGRGAMGRVYRAFDPNIGRNVALKVIPIESGDPEMAARFRREAQAAGTLSHPNIVTIFDAGSDGGYLYIAMELVEGETLQKILLSGALPLEQAIAFSEQTGAALDHAHARGIVHRDIKPANIMVQKGQVKVTDFGVAKIGGAGMTSTGSLLGTPSYLAPEVVKGEPVSARSDIFSLGVVLYEMLTGVRPFAGDTLTTVIYRILSETPQPPAEMIASLPAGLDDVVLKALAKHPEERYGSGAELAADLRPYAAPGAQGKQQPLSAGPAATGTEIKEKTQNLDAGALAMAVSKRASSRTRAMWTSALAVLLLGGAIFWSVRRTSAPLLIPDDATTPAQSVAATPNDAPGVSAARATSAPTQHGSPGAANDPTADKPSAFGAPVTPASTDETQPGTLSSAGSAAGPAAGSASQPKGRVLVRTLPAGAVIHLNGDATEYRSPVTFALAPGHYQITIDHAGFRTETKEIDVEANREVTMDVEMRRGILRRLNPFRR